MARITTTPTPLVTAAGLAAAVHVIDDNIVDPGLANAGSHVASTFIPLAVVGFLMWATTRGRPGSRSVATLALGLVALTLGSEAIYHAATSTLGADDWTGLLAATGGLVVAALGARDLWRGRTRGRHLRHLAQGIGGFLVLVFAIYPVVEAYAMSNTASRTSPPVPAGAGYQSVTFRSTEGARLSGWYRPSTNGAAVIVAPGRGRTQAYAQMLYQHGYGVLLFDEGGVGGSEGEYNSWGWGSQHDVHGAVKFLRRQPDVDDGRIGGIGLSVGGEVLLHAASENPDLRAVVSEGAGARSWKEYLELDGVAPWLWGPVSIARTAATAVFTNRMPPPKLHELVAEIEQPVMFIYATRSLGGETLTEDYYDLATGPKELWKTDSGHTGGLRSDRQMYEDRVVEFLDDALRR